MAQEKINRGQENETTGRATFDSWKPLKLYACCELGAGTGLGLGHPLLSLPVAYVNFLLA